MDYVFTQDFLDVYEVVPESEVGVVDAAIERLLLDPTTAWARQNRVQGERNAAWFVVIRAPSRDLHLYWVYLDAATLVLLALVPF